MHYNKYEWQLSFNNDGVDAQCIVNPESTGAHVIDQIPISDDPKISWPNAQEEAKSILRMKCTRDILQTEWNDIQAACYAISNHKWLDQKLIDAVKRRWPNELVAEQWLILGAMVVNYSTYRKWIEKLLPVTETSLINAWHTWPGEQENQVLAALSHLVSISDCSTEKAYVLPDANDTFYEFNGYRLLQVYIPRVAGGVDLWEIWQSKQQFIIRHSIKNGWIESLTPIQKSLNAIDVLTYMEEQLNIHSKHPQINERIEALTKIATAVKLDVNTILSKLWTSDELAKHILITALYPNKTSDWYNDIKQSQTAFDAIVRIKELDHN